MVCRRSGGPGCPGCPGRPVRRRARPAARAISTASARACSARSEATCVSAATRSGVAAAAAARAVSASAVARFSWACRGSTSGGAVTRTPTRVTDSSARPTAPRPKPAETRAVRGLPAGRQMGLGTATSCHCPFGEPVTGALFAASATVPGVSLVAGATGDSPGREMSVTTQDEELVVTERSRGLPSPPEVVELLDGDFTRAGFEIDSVGVDAAARPPRITVVADGDAALDLDSHRRVVARRIRTARQPSGHRRALRSGGHFAGCGPPADR